MNKYLITGGTSDLGQCLIRHLLLKDSESIVYVHGYNGENKIKEIENEFWGHVIYIDTDLSSNSSTDALISNLSEGNIHPTHFVHFPALPVINVNFKNFDEDRFYKDMEVQVHSAVKISKYVLSEMKKSKFGRIVFMQTSYAIGVPPKNVAAYTMVKSSIGALVKSLAIDYAKFGITVNCVAPSMIETNFVKDLNHIVVEMSASENPMGRNATVEDVVPAIEFLLSEEARYITGVTLPVTGGSVML